MAREHSQAGQSRAGQVAAASVTHRVRELPWKEGVNISRVLYSAMP